MKIRNFNNILFNNNFYGGKAGKKLGFNWNDEKWFLKFPKSKLFKSFIIISCTLNKSNFRISFE